MLRCLLDSLLLTYYVTLQTTEHMWKFSLIFTQKVFVWVVSEALKAVDKNCISAQEATILNCLHRCAQWQIVKIREYLSPRTQVVKSIVQWSRDIHAPTRALQEVGSLAKITEEMRVRVEIEVEEAIRKVQMPIAKL